MPYFTAPCYNNVRLLLQWRHMNFMLSQIIDHSTVCSMKHQRSASLAFCVRESSGDQCLPSQRASDVVNDSISQHYHESHYNDVIMTTIASQITSLAVVYSTVYSDPDQRKYQSSASLAFVWGIHRDRWIPRTKGQLRGKCFHLMTSSWVSQYLLITC